MRPRPEMRGLIVAIDQAVREKRLPLLEQRRECTRCLRKKYPDEFPAQRRVCHECEAERAREHRRRRAA